MVAEAIENKWDSSEARSHVKAKKGHDAPIMDGTPGKPSYRYLVLQPGMVPLWSNEQPAWSTGVQVFDLKKRMYLVDDGSKVDWVAGEVSK